MSHEFNESLHSNKCSSSVKDLKVQAIVSNNRCVVACDGQSHYEVTIPWKNDLFPIPS